MSAQRTLRSFWNADRQDTVAVASDEGERVAVGAGYLPLRTEGRVWAGGIPGAVALGLWWSADRQDSRTVPGWDRRLATAAGYALVRIEGHVVLRPPSVAFTRYRSWWSDARSDSVLTGSVHGDAEAVASGCTRVDLAACFGPAQRPITVESELSRHRGGSAGSLAGRGFTPGDTVYASALITTAGVSEPEVTLGSARVDEHGGFRGLEIDTADDLPVVRGERWRLVVADAASGSELDLGPIG